MDEGRRRAYLSAMGVTVWEVRSPEGFALMGADQTDATPRPEEPMEHSGALVMSEPGSTQSGEDVERDAVSRQPGRHSERPPEKPVDTASVACGAQDHAARAAPASVDRNAGGDVQTTSEAPVGAESAMRGALDHAVPTEPQARFESGVAEPPLELGDDLEASAQLDDWDAYSAMLQASGGSLMSEPDSAREEAFDPVARMDWGALEAAVRDCRACGLCETRTQTVFGTGDRSADLMIIGEAPGADEDRAGEPFVGRAGQLLTRMLAAIGLGRDQVYIANVLKCRPPGNRDPKPEEACRCEPFLMRQIALLRPKVILSVGRISAQHLLRTETSLGRLRGRWLELGEQSIPLRVTYHPSYLLRSPEQKAKAWADLTEVKRRLDDSR